MTGVLWIIRDLPADPHHGGYLRFISIAKELATTRRMFLAAISCPEDSAAKYRELGIFDEVYEFTEPSESLHWSRHLRLSNRNFIKRAFPTFFRSAIDQLSNHIRRNEIDTAIAVTLPTAEFLEALPCSTRIVDDYDCATLTLEREFAANTGSESWKKKLSRRLHLLRTIRFESTIASNFDLITTISKPDQQCLVRISNGHTDNIQVIKNGVDEVLLSKSRTGYDEKDTVVFWGNLEFQPNYHAVQHFYRDVYAPFLEQKGIRWVIVGAGADSTIRELSDRHQNIELAGFVDDLAAHVCRYPVMINPMVSGSGLKNKVLEAFALRRAVVSTKMGAEAIEATPDVHYLEADRAEDFAHAVQRCLSDNVLHTNLADAAYDFVAKKYRWQAIGNEFEQLIEAAEAKAIR